MIGNDQQRSKIFQHDQYSTKKGSAKLVLTSLISPSMVLAGTDDSGDASPEGAQGQFSPMLYSVHTNTIERIDRKRSQVCFLSKFVPLQIFLSFVALATMRGWK